MPSTIRGEFNIQLFPSGSRGLCMRTCGIWSIIIKLTVHNHRLRLDRRAFSDTLAINGLNFVLRFFTGGGRYRFGIWIAVIRHTFVSDAA